MNRTKKEELRKYKEVRKGLSPKEIEELDKKEAINKSLETKSRELYYKFFSEETDFMYDSGADAYSRKHGRNPMNSEYINRVSRKREKLNIPQLNSSGLATGKEAQNLCNEMAFKLHEKVNIPKKILYIDMDGVIVDFQSGIDQLDEKTQKEYEGRLDEVPEIFSLMKPWKGAIETIKELKNYYDIYILSTAPWENPSAWSDKLIWIKKYLEPEMHKRLILSHNKHLNKGDFLIDDRTANGADRFTGKHLHFNTKEFPNWDYIKDFLHAEYIESVIKD